MRIAILLALLFASARADAALVVPFVQSFTVVPSAPAPGEPVSLRTTSISAYNPCVVYSPNSRTVDPTTRTVTYSQAAPTPAARPAARSYRHKSW